MFGWFRKAKTRPEDTEAYKNGREAGAAMGADLDRFMDARFTPTFEGYLSVIRGQLEKCIDPADAPPIVAARIEFDIFRDNVEKLRVTMLSEIDLAMHRWLDIAKEVGVHGG